MKWNDLSFADVQAMMNVIGAVEESVGQLALVGDISIDDLRISMVPGKPVTFTLPSLVFPEVGGLCSGACTDTVAQGQEAFEAEAERMASVRGLVQRMAAPTAPEPVGEAEALRQTVAWLARGPEVASRVCSEPECVGCGFELAMAGDELCVQCRSDAALRELEDKTDGTDDDPFLVAPTSPAEAPTCDTSETLGRPALWSEADDQTAIWMTANGHPAEAVAARVGRPVEGTKWRLKNKLRDRIAEARALISEAAGQPARPDEPGAITTEDPAQDAAPEEPDAALAAVVAPVPPEAGGGTNLAPAGIDPDLWAHAQAVPRGKIWTLQRDLELLELAELGWSPDEIGLELHVVGKEIKPRFDVLTAARRWKRAEVLAALRELAQVEAA